MIRPNNFSSLLDTSILFKYIKYRTWVPIYYFCPKPHKCGPNLGKEALKRECDVKNSCWLPLMSFVVLESSSSVDGEKGVGKGGQGLRGIH